MATYVIPANDDAVNSIKTISMLLADAVKEGKEQWEKNKLAIDKETKRVEVKKVAASSEEKVSDKPSVAKAPVSTAPKKERRVMTKESSI